MNAIAAVSADWGIGYRNDLLFSIPEDMKYFRRMTKGGTVILGRRNLESFPGGRPLPNRRHLLLTKDPSFAAEGVEIYHSIEEVLAVIKDIPEDDVWVIGGGQIYRLFLPYCRKAYITHIDSTVPAEVFSRILKMKTAGSWQKPGRSSLTAILLTDSPFTRTGSACFKRLRRQNLE